MCNHGYSCGYDANAANANDVVKLNENIIRVGVNFKFWALVGIQAAQDVEEETLNEIETHSY